MCLLIKRIAVSIPIFISKMNLFCSYRVLKSHGLLQVRSNISLEVVILPKGSLAGKRVRMDCNTIKPDLCQRPISRACWRLHSKKTTAKTILDYGFSTKKEITAFPEEREQSRTETNMRERERDSWGRGEREMYMKGDRKFSREEGKNQGKIG